MSEAEELLARARDRGYLVQCVFQRYDRDWEVTLRSPHDFYYRTGTGKSFADALRHALEETARRRSIRIRI